MLQPEKVLAALKRKQALFHEAHLRLRSDVNRLHGALVEWATRPAAALEAALQDIPWPGARPTIEQDTQPLIIPFPQRWINHQQARAWALKTLEGVTTFAADGSQILMTGDLSIPVGLVQIGWFENHHVNDGQGRFEKDIEVEVLVPYELGGAEATSIDNDIDWHRFHGELSHIEQFMEAQPAESQRAVAFFDGS